MESAKMSGVPETGAGVTNREGEPNVEQQVRVPDSSSSAHPSSIPPGSILLTHVASPSPSDHKRRRGRPRVYDLGGSMAMPVATAHQLPDIPPQVELQPPAPVFPPQEEVQLPAPAGGSASRKPRGRTPGSSNKRRPAEALGSIDDEFVPNVIDVKAGEDVYSKILTYSQNATKVVSVMSANGIVSNVTLRQRAASSGIATYEGLFNIHSLSGTITLTERDGQRTQAGGLNATFIGPDGTIIGGRVVGLLVAATPVQVVVASFVVDDQEEPRPSNHAQSSSALS